MDTLDSSGIAQISLQVVKNAFSWGFHFYAYSVCPDKSF